MFTRGSTVFKCPFKEHISHLVKLSKCLLVEIEVDQLSRTQPNLFIQVSHTAVLRFLDANVRHIIYNVQNLL